MRWHNGSRYLGDVVESLSETDLTDFGGSIMTNYADRQRQAKVRQAIASYRAQQRLDERREQDRLYGREGLIREMWARGYEEDVKQERAENAYRISQVLKRHEAADRAAVDPVFAAKTSEHRRRMAALQARVPKSKRSMAEPRTRLENERRGRSR
jgi:hypothetical protein